MATGLLGYLLLTYPPYPVVLGIHLALGITSIVTFWSALVKAIRSLANSDEQGRAFGLFEGGRGIVNKVQSAIILSLFGYLASKFSDKTALSAIITVYSTICLLLGLLVFTMYKDPAVRGGEKIELSKKVFEKRGLPKSRQNADNLAVHNNNLHIILHDHKLLLHHALRDAGIWHLRGFCRRYGLFLSVLPPCRLFRKRLHGR